MENCSAGDHRGLDERMKKGKGGRAWSDLSFILRVLCEELRPRLFRNFIEVAMQHYCCNASSKLYRLDDAYYLVASKLSKNDRHSRAQELRTS